MRVMATKQGQYCNMLIEPGWVFDLLNDAPADAPRMNPQTGELTTDGSGIPVREDWIPTLVQDPKTKQMVDSGEGDWKIFIDKRTKKPIHRDFSRDEGRVMLKRGPIRGESVEVGWMEEVPETVPVTEFDGTPLNEMLAQLRHGFNPDTRKLRLVSPSVRKDPEKSQGAVASSGKVTPVAKVG
jgi:hypothetical protein